MLNNQAKHTLLLLVCSMVCITVLSMCSFIYAHNPWSDLNIFLTIGRSMLDGKQMYVDLFDHKGPIVYLVYAVLSFISRTNYIGVYLLEIISLFFFLYYSDKIMKLYSTKNHYLGLLMIGVVVCTSKAFSFGGGSIEEFALPLFQANLYFMLKHMLHNDSFRRTECIFIGVSAAILFLSKFTLMGFYFGLAIVLIVFQSKQDKTLLLPCVLYTFASFLLVVCIVFGYLLLKGNLNAMIHGYFWFNLFSYVVNESIIMRVYSMARAFFFFWKNNLLLVSISTIGLGYLSYQNREHKRILWGLIILAVSWYLIAFIGGRFIHYYILPISIFSIGFVLWMEKYKASIIFGGVMIVSILLSYNIKQLPIRKSIQAQILDSIPTDQDFLLYHGYDQGFYLLRQETPKCRYFTKVNFDSDVIEQELQSCIYEEKIPYLISMDEEITLKNYQLVMELDGEYDQKTHQYRIYQLNH